MKHVFIALISLFAVNAHAFETIYRAELNNFNADPKLELMTVNAGNVDVDITK